MAAARAPERGIDYPITLGPSLMPSNATSVGEYLTLRYDFKPASASQAAQGRLEVQRNNQASLGDTTTVGHTLGGPATWPPRTPTTVLFTFRHGPVSSLLPQVQLLVGDSLLFQGKYEAPGREGLDCVAIFDGTGFRLELLTAAVQSLRHVNGAGRAGAGRHAASARASTPVPPGRAPTPQPPAAQQLAAGAAEAAAPQEPPALPSAKKRAKQQEESEQQQQQAKRRQPSPSLASQAARAQALQQQQQGLRPSPEAVEQDELMLEEELLKALAEEPLGGGPEEPLAEQPQAQAQQVKQEQAQQQLAQQQQQRQQVQRHAHAQQQQPARQQHLKQAAGEPGKRGGVQALVQQQPQQQQEEQQAVTAAQGLEAALLAERVDEGVAAPQVAAHGSTPQEKEEAAVAATPEAAPPAAAQYVAPAAAPAPAVVGYGGEGNMEGEYDLEFFSTL